MSSIRETKKALRKKMREEVQQKLSEDEIARQTDAVTKSLFSHPGYQNAQSLGVYLSTKTGELRTDAIIRHAFEKGKNVYVPSWSSQFSEPDEKPRLLPEMRMVRCDSLPSYEHLPENKWGIREPVLKGSDSFAFDQSDDKSGLDIVVMPGVAFTKSGKRLGYGKGYYDKFLDAAEQWSKARSKQSLSTIAIAFSEQIVDENDIPLDPDGHDKTMDHILTPEGALR